MKVVYVDNREQKEKIIKECDSAFEIKWENRPFYNETFDKIDNYAFFVAIYENEISVGYAAMYANDFINHVAFISMIGVQPQYQRKSIGSILMQQCVTYAKKQEMKCIRLSVSNENKIAIEFYKRWGFVKEKNESAKMIFMQKKL